MSDHIVHAAKHGLFSNTMALIVSDCCGRILSGVAHRISLPSHCLCTAFPWPSTARSLLIFLDLPLPLHRLSLPFHCLCTAFLTAAATTLSVGGTKETAHPLSAPPSLQCRGAQGLGARRAEGTAGGRGERARVAAVGILRRDCSCEPWLTSLEVALSARVE